MFWINIQWFTKFISNQKNPKGGSQAFISWTQLFNRGLQPITWLCLSVSSKGVFAFNHFATVEVTFLQKVTIALRIVLFSRLIWVDPITAEPHTTAAWQGDSFHLETTAVAASHLSVRPVWVLDPPPSLITHTHTNQRCTTTFSADTHTHTLSTNSAVI